MSKTNKLLSSSVAKGTFINFRSVKYVMVNVPHRVGYVPQHALGAPGIKINSNRVPKRVGKSAPAKTVDAAKLRVFLERLKPLESHGIQLITKEVYKNPTIARTDLQIRVARELSAQAGKYVSPSFVETLLKKAIQSRSITEKK